jgi:O-antigen/teichoic acid export membrane protein
MKLSHRSPIVRYAEITFVEGRRARSGCDVLIGVARSTALLLVAVPIVSMAFGSAMAVALLLVATIAAGAITLASVLTPYEQTGGRLEIAIWTMGTGVVLALAFVGVRSACRRVEID